MAETEMKQEAAPKEEAAKSTPEPAKEKPLAGEPVMLNGKPLTLPHSDDLDGKLVFWSRRGSTWHARSKTAGKKLTDAEKEANKERRKKERARRKEVAKKLRNKMSDARQEVRKDPLNPAKQAKARAAKLEYELYMAESKNDQARAALARREFGA